MKRKGLTYLLLALVLLLWSFIGIKVFSFVDKKEIEPISEKTISSTETESIAIENFELLLDYDDPFLNTPKPKKRLSEKHLIKAVQKPAPRPPSIDCAYKGLLKKGNKNLAMLRFEKKGLILEKGQEKEGIALLDLFQDSLSIKYSGYKYTIYKNQKR